MIQSHLKDQAAATAVSNAVKNSLGAIQQAATSTVIAYHPTVTVPVTPQMAAGVQYVLDNAGDEAARLGITQEKIASKIEAQIGLANIATNQATAVSPALTPAPGFDPGGIAAGREGCAVTLNRSEIPMLRMGDLYRRSSPSGLSDAALPRSVPPYSVTASCSSKDSRRLRPSRRRSCPAYRPPT